MSRHRRTAIVGAPLTTTELSGIEFPSEKGKVIKCCECDLPGGTLVRERDKDGNHTGRYYHQNVKKCQLLKASKMEVKSGRKSKAGNTKAVPRAGRAR